MNGREDNAKRFALSSRPFIKGLMLFSLSRLGISQSSYCESPPDECFNPPLELFLQVLDGQFQLFALMRVRFASKVVLISPNLRPKETKRRSITPMNLNTLKDVRHGIYGCFGNAKPTGCATR
jgi:hypothetical protein